MEIIPEIERVLTLEGEAILSCAKSLRTPEVNKAFQAAIKTLQTSLDQGGKIIVTGVGKSGKIAQKIAATLSSTGSLAIFIHPTEGLHGDLGVVTSKDVVLCLSYSGNTEEILRLIPSFKKLGTSLIGLGGNPKSKLAEACHVWIPAQVEQEACPHNLAPTTSSTLSLAIGDALAITLMRLKGFNIEAFAENHPGGSIGRKINLKVSELMHTGSAVATVSGTASMDEVIVLATEKKLGAVLVTEGQKLLGIITDGDLRRALKHREKFFALKAKDIMTTKPVTASAEMLASEALQLMEGRSSQISVLAIVDHKNHWQGVLRLHDLVQNL